MIQKPLPILNTILRPGHNTAEPKPLQANQTQRPRPAAKAQQPKPFEPAFNAASHLRPKIESGGKLTAVEIDFVVERIVEKHSVAMKHELKTVLNMLSSHPKGTQS